MYAVSRACVRAFASARACSRPRSRVQRGRLARVYGGAGRGGAGRGGAGRGGSGLTGREGGAGLLRVGGVRPRLVLQLRAVPVPLLRAPAGRRSPGTTTRRAEPARADRAGRGSPHREGAAPSQQWRGAGGCVPAPTLFRPPSLRKCVRPRPLALTVASPPPPPPRLPHPTSHHRRSLRILLPSPAPPPPPCPYSLRQGGLPPPVHPSPATRPDGSMERRAPAQQPRAGSDSTQAATGGRARRPGLPPSTRRWERCPPGESSRGTAAGRECVRVPCRRVATGREGTRRLAGRGRVD